MTYLKYHLIVERYHVESFKIFTGMPFGPDDLWESNDDITKEI